MSDNIFAQTTSFNSILKRLIKFTTDKSIALRTHDLKKRISLLINENPLMVIDTLGPYLLEYAEQIKAHSGEFFINKDFTDEVSVDSADEKEQILKLVRIIKKIYANSSITEREFVNDSMEDLLISYCRYLIEKRQDEKS